MKIGISELKRGLIEKHKAGINKLKAKIRPIMPYAVLCAEKLKLNRRWMRIGILSVCVAVFVFFVALKSTTGTDDQRIMPIFPDVSRSDKQFIETAYMNDIMTDTGDGKFGTENACTASEAAYIEVWLYEWKNDIEHSFTEYSPNSEEYIEKAKEYGIWNIDKNASEALTINDAMAVLAPVVDDSEPNITDDTDYPTLKDEPEKDAVTKLFNKGIALSSKLSEAYSSDKHINRAEMARLVGMILNPDVRLKEVTAEPDKANLEEVINGVTAGYDGNWSTYYEDYKTGEKVVINSHQVYSASLIKLFVIQTVYQAIANGELSDSDYIEEDLSRMITYSDNDAWKELARTLGGGSYMEGMQKVTETAQAAGFSDSGQFMKGDKNNYNFTSVLDCGTYMHKILSGEIVSKEYSDKILDLLKKQEVLYKIPAGVPDNVVTANKTGELEYVQGDAAIVYAPSGTYILVVIASDINDEGAAQEGIRKVSEAVYNYLEGAN